MEYPDGFYTGEFLDAKRWGQGKFEYADGSYHEGQFYDDKFWNGKGTVKYTDMSFYEGDFANG